MPDLFGHELKKADWTLIRECTECHKSVGYKHGKMAVPAINGMNAHYLEHVLREIAGGTWKSQVMSPIASSLSSIKIDQVAAYYAMQAPFSRLKRNDNEKWQTHRLACCNPGRLERRDTCVHAMSRKWRSGYRSTLSSVVRTKCGLH